MSSNMTVSAAEKAGIVKFYVRKLLNIWQTADIRKYNIKHVAES